MNSIIVSSLDLKSGLKTSSKVKILLLQKTRQTRKFY